LLSRVADNLYWMSRYLERAEHTARVMDVHLNLMLEQDGEEQGGRWSRVLACLGNHETLPGADVFAAAQNFALKQILDSIASARDNARQVREQVSSEMWEELNRLFHESKRMIGPEFWTSQAHDSLHAITDGSYMFQGITDSTMIHGEGWQFIQVGRFMERAQATARLIDSHFAAFFQKGRETHTAAEHMEWIGLLRSCAAFEAYCKVYTADLRPERVAEFLLMNSDFPHSTRFAAEGIRRSLGCIHDVAANRKAERLTKLAGRLASALSYTPVDEVMADVHGFTVTIRKLCAQIHTGMFQVYITYHIDAALGA